MWFIIKMKLLTDQFNVKLRLSYVLTCIQSTYTVRFTLLCNRSRGQSLFVRLPFHFVDFYRHGWNVVKVSEYSLHRARNFRHKLGGPSIEMKSINALFSNGTSIHSIPSSHELTLWFRCYRLNVIDFTQLSSLLETSLINVISAPWFFSISARVIPKIWMKSSMEMRRTLLVLFARFAATWFSGDPTTGCCLRSGDGH